MSSDLSIMGSKPAPELSQSQIPTAELSGKSVSEQGTQDFAKPSSSPAGNAASPQQALDSAAQQAAQDLYQGREVKVTGLMDESSGRMVYRVTDNQSGEVLAQSPSDVLLRFYASGRAEQDGNIIAIEA